MDADTILAELDKFFERDERKPGDIDAAQLADHYGITVRAAAHRMHQIGGGLSGYKLLRVFDPARASYINVLRKIEGYD